MNLHLDIPHTPRTHNHTYILTTPTLRMDSQVEFIKNLHINSPIVREPRKIHRQHNKRKPPTRDPPSPKSSLSSEVLSFPTSQLVTLLSSKTIQASLRFELTSMLSLGDWMRYTASTLKMKKNIYNRALLLLRLSSSPEGSTHPMAAASLSLIIKFQYSQFMRKVRELPPRNTELISTRPVVEMADIIEHEYDVLKAIGFNIPICDVFLKAMLGVCEKWTMYLHRNSKHMTLPLKYLETGLGSEWQKRNIYNVSYLVDLINLTPVIREQLGHQQGSLLDLRKQEFSEDQIILISAAVLLNAATNSCITDSLSTEDYLLLRFMRAFLKKCFNFSDQHLHHLERVLRRCVECRLWSRLSLVHPHTQLPKQNPLNEEEKLEWLDQLEYIPMSEDAELQL